MKTEKRIAKEFTNHEIKSAFKELVKWNKSGKLPSGVISNLMDKEKFNLKEFELEILYEIGERYSNS